MKAFKRSGVFIICQVCEFKYLPFNDYTRCNCPKCSPESSLNEDEVYLLGEEVEEEEVNIEGNEYSYPIWRNYDQ